MNENQEPVVMATQLPPSGCDIQSLRDIRIRVLIHESASCNITDNFWTYYINT